MEMRFPCNDLGVFIGEDWVLGSFFCPRHSFFFIFTLLYDTALIPRRVELETRGTIPANNTY